jgi:protein associated with RNAse G/E
MKEILLRQLKHDGSCYRWHPAQVVYEAADGFVLRTPRGTSIRNVKDEWPAFFDSYRYFWYGRWYTLLVLFDASAELVELYVDIAGPVRFTDGVVSYIDYELDVTSIDGPRLVDEDEFAEAVEKYGYSTELQAQCYAAAAEALALVARWQVGLSPEQALAQIDGMGE